MDRALKGLPILAPGCSAWQAIEAHLNAMGARSRNRNLYKYLGAAAASLVFVVLVLGGWHASEKGVDELQNIVDAAIRDARPGLMFSSHRYDGENPPLEALLVKAAPRDISKDRPVGEAPRQEGARSRSPAENGNKAF